jgi:peptidoglycan/xylan/chitin deacetylase (PgdA/CDA1 family)
MNRIVGKVNQLSRRLRNHYVPGALILLYHRITEARPDPWECCVSPRNFAEQLAVLQSKFRPVPLERLADTVAQEKPSLLSRRAVAVTFDDGYADNLETAKPLLERYEVPATVFVTSGNIGRAREFWSDELERLLLQPGTLPSQLQFSLNGEALKWNLDGAEHQGVATFQQHQGWSAWQSSDPTARHTLYRQLYSLLQPLEENAREQVFAELREQTGISAAARETHRFLTRDELCLLAAGELIEIGGHAVTHPLLSGLSPQAQRDEILEGRLFLEQTLRRPITSFAYPYGDFGAETPTIVREAGFARACLTRRGVVRPETDRCLLPRVQVKDWNGKEFAAWLTHWLYD